MTDAPVRILLARHGEADYETAGALAGGTLTTEGREQAHALGERLRGEGVSAIACSELSRAVQTAEIVAAALDLPVRVRDGLQEYDIGDERGKPYNPDVFEPLLLSWLAGDLSPGIPGGEDGPQVARRMFRVLDDLADAHPGGTVLAVSHGGAIIAVLGSIAPGDPRLPRDGNDTPGGGYVVLERAGGEWTLVRGFSDDQDFVVRAPDVP